MKKTKIQGLCNEVFYFKSLDKKFILRLFKKKHHIKIDRKQEFKIQKKANKKSLAPKPLILDKKNNFMIYEYAYGIHKKNLTKKDIKKLAKALKSLHKIKYKKQNYFLEKEFKNYKKILKNNKNRTLINDSLKLLKTFKKSKKDLVLCHNDLNQNNIIFAKNIYFIDWEFANTNNRFFDLATICIKFKLTKKDEKLFLSHYFCNNKKQNYQNLKKFKKICENYWKLWFKVNF